MNRLRTVYKVLGMAGLFVIIALPTLQIFMRTVFSAPINGAEELARYMLIVITYVALPLAVVDGGHVSMEEFQGVLPARARRIVRLLVKAAAVLGYGFVGLAAVVTMTQNMQNATSTLSIPFYIFIAPVIFGMAFMAFEYLLALVKEAKAGRD